MVKNLLNLIKKRGGKLGALINKKSLQLGKKTIRKINSFIILYKVKNI